MVIIRCGWYFLCVYTFAEVINFTHYFTLCLYFGCLPLTFRRLLPVTTLSELWEPFCALSTLERKEFTYWVNEDVEKRLAEAVDKSQKQEEEKHVSLKKMT